LTAGSCCAIHWKISMKDKILFGTIALLAGSLLAADSNPQDAVKDAAKQLGAKDNYGWMLARPR
jgi:hypothetical protein